MPAHDRTLPESYRRLVARVIGGGPPTGLEFDACRAVLANRPSRDEAFQALCMLLEGALADASLPIDDTQELVPLLKALARRDVVAEELL
jgi:hypothetical protein